jgi:hypothetical protein
LLHRSNFFLSVKCFIAVTFYRKTSFTASSLLLFKRNSLNNASSPFLFKRNSSLNASSPLLFKVALPTSGKKRAWHELLFKVFLAVLAFQSSNLLTGTDFATLLLPHNNLIGIFFVLHTPST